MKEIKFIWLVLILTTLLVLKEYPYFNILLVSKLIGAIIFVLAILLFSVKPEFLFKAALFLLLLVLILTLFHFSRLSELVGELIYFLLVLGVILKLSDLPRLV